MASNGTADDTDNGAATADANSNHSSVGGGGGGAYSPPRRASEFDDQGWRVEAIAKHKSEAALKSSQMADQMLDADGSGSSGTDDGDQDNEVKGGRDGGGDGGGGSEGEGEGEGEGGDDGGDDGGDSGGSGGGGTASSSERDGPTAPAMRNMGKKPLKRRKNQGRNKSPPPGPVHGYPVRVHVYDLLDQECSADLGVGKWNLGRSLSSLNDTTLNNMSLGFFHAAVEVRARDDRFLTHMASSLLGRPHTRALRLAPRYAASSIRMATVRRAPASTRASR